MGFDIEETETWVDFIDECGGYTRLMKKDLNEAGYFKAEWQPMHTAPKDGTSILIGSPVGGVYQCSWRKSRFEGQGAIPVGERWYVHGSESNRYGEADATHWMPLPQPPLLD